MQIAFAKTISLRKLPVQSRSAASVDAMLTATIQVLLDVGTERLTTTRVAARAGVSVGTLYQYFPNKSSLLQAVLRRHFEAIRDAVELSCERHRGKPLANIAEALVNGYLEVKLRDPRISVALYRIHGNLDAEEVMEKLAMSMRASMTALLASSTDVLADPATVAAMLQGTMFGVSRQMLEAGAGPEQVRQTRRELIELVRAYLASRATST